MPMQSYILLNTISITGASNMLHANNSEAQTNKLTKDIDWSWNG